MTRMIVTLLILGAGLALPTASRAQSASDVIDRVIEAETANYAGIERLFKLSRTLGHPVPEYMERQDGQLITVPISELFGEQQPNALSDAPPEALRDAAAILGYESTTVDAAMEQEMASAGLTGGIGSALLMASNPDEPWLTGSPGGMMRLYADWLNAAADSKEAIAAERVKDAAEAERNLEALEAAKARTRCRQPRHCAADRGRHIYHGNPANVSSCRSILTRAVSHRRNTSTGKRHSSYDYRTHRQSFHQQYPRVRQPVSATWQHHAPG